MKRREILHNKKQSQSQQPLPQLFPGDNKIVSKSRESEKNYTSQEYTNMKNNLQLRLSKYRDSYKRLQERHKQYSKKMQQIIRDQLDAQITSIRAQAQFEMYQNKVKIQDLNDQIEKHKSLLIQASLKSKESEKKILSDILQATFQQSKAAKPHAQKDHEIEIKMKRQNDSLKVTNKKLEDVVKGQLIQLKQYSSKISNREKGQKLAQKTIYQLKSQLNEQKQKYRRLHSQTLSIVISQNQHKSKVQDLSKKIQSLQIKNKQLLIIQQQYKKKVQQKNEEIDRLHNEVGSCQDDNKILRTEKNNIEKRIQSISEQCGVKSIDFLKNTELLYQCIINYKYFSESKFLRKQQYSQKLFLINSIKQFLSINRIKAQLLYRDDEINPINFHQYIDGHQNILLVINLGDGNIIGGFSVYPLIQNNTKKMGRGFLFSLPLEKIYPLKNNAKFPVIVYDQYFLIFGNSEIRIKSHEKRLFSNFGFSSSSFDSLGDTAQNFLQTRVEGIRQLEIINFEVYKITEQ